jgi:hypothetical protein
VNIILRFLTLLGAAFMLLVSTGASISIHYCNGNVIDFAVNKRAKACDGYYELEIDNSVGCSVSRKGCCEDDDRLLLVENDYPPTYNTDFQKTPIVSLLSIEEHLIFSAHPLVKVECLANAPPLIETDYQALFQVFVI